MRVPDETEYGERERHLEDTSWRYCCHCVHCPINNQNAIFIDGAFYCDYIKQWKDGDDLLESRCLGYRQKQCRNCKNGLCKVPKWIRNEISFCNNYSRFFNAPERYYGRRRVRSERAYNAEERYRQKIKEMYDEQSSYDTESGIDEAGEQRKETAGNEAVGSLSLPDTNKENQIDIFA